MKTLLVTGTDTGVGKTWISRLLIRELRNQGIDTGAYKPACSGSERHSDGSECWADVETLYEACDGEFDRSLICPQTFSAPLAPNVAALEEGRTVNPALIFSAMELWRKHVDHLVIEGAGGLLSPLADSVNSLDLAIASKSSVLIVAANRLGVINHTLLTVRAVVAAGLSIAAVVLNEIQPPGDEAGDQSRKSNLTQLQRLIPEMPVLTCGWGSDRIHPVRETTLAEILGWSRAA
jgi:dethiobiotin synthetase